jgi:chromosome segregation ATPase
MNDRYIQNVHDAPITCHVMDPETRQVLSEKKFMPAMIEKWSGKQLTTGYTKITEEELALLREHSRTFQHYSEKLKLLLVCDDIPPEAKTPHEALVDARKETRRLTDQIAELEAENTQLKADLHDAKDAAGKLLAATTGDEALAEIRKELGELKVKNASLESNLDLTRQEIERLNAENSRLKAALTKKPGKGGS